MAEGRILYFYRNSPRPADIRASQALGATLADATAWHGGDPIKGNITAVAGYVPEGYLHLPRAEVPGTVDEPDPPRPTRGRGRPPSASRRGRPSGSRTSPKPKDAEPSPSTEVSEPASE